MKTHPLVEFPGSVAVALDAIESIDWVNDESTRITTHNGRQYTTPCHWDVAMEKVYQCIGHNRA